VYMGYIAECDEGGDASDGGLVWGAGGAHDNGDIVNFGVITLAAERVHERGVLSRISCAVRERLAHVQYFHPPI
jgi:hypothetical protein